MKLSDKDLEQAPKGASPLDESTCEGYLNHLSPGWIYKNPTTPLILSFPTTSFEKARSLANLIGEMADQVWHHPRLTIEFKRLTVEILTHDIQGLYHSDFIFAAKVDHLLGLDKR